MTWRSCLGSTRRKATWSPPSSRPSPSSTQPWPPVGRFLVSDTPSPSPSQIPQPTLGNLSWPSPCCPVDSFFILPGPFTLLNKHHTEILPIDNTMANTILMVRCPLFQNILQHLVSGIRWQRECHQGGEPAANHEHVHRQLLQLRDQQVPGLLPAQGDSFSSEIVM